MIFTTVHTHLELYGPNKWYQSSQCCCTWLCVTLGGPALWTPQKRYPKDIKCNRHHQLWYQLVRTISSGQVHTAAKMTGTARMRRKGYIIYEILAWQRTRNGLSSSLLNENRYAYRANNYLRLEVELQTLQTKTKEVATRYRSYYISTFMKMVQMAIVKCPIAVSAPLVWAPNGADTNVHDLL